MAADSNRTKEKRLGWEHWYRALKAVDPDAYRKAVGYMEACSLNFQVPQNAAAEYERSAVMLACELLKIKLRPCGCREGAAEFCAECY